ncbi:nucleotide sugar dehydrogenase [Capnocytophaga leadbetteri]|uniref:nucleotide sugar dehydrogenase n=1 Tax=Capnocytophaga leadbetteri TaxID=327575 RepID=UPI0026EFCD74|nr:nucleotide sugar dehydrogenase [Capnocytophaga leadbetteri]
MKSYKIGIIGLGYVGFPLACLFAKKYPTVGYDPYKERVARLSEGVDVTNEISTEVIQARLSTHLRCTANPNELRDCNVYIVAVPTPIDLYQQPDLTALREASSTVGSLLKQGDIVIYESTVYPGVTEEVCVPILEQKAGLTFNRDFYVGYSPERINPGDKQHTVENICKITSGSTPEIAREIDALYNSVLTGGTYLASSIKVAEAAKVIENAQRDVNIAFMNEIAKIFNILDIDTNAVIDAASSKWNFLPFRPGLVGGHCIGVDPYYLIQKAKLHGVSPRLMMEARKTNDSMGGYIAYQIINQLCLRGLPVKDSRVLLLGFTFKENCPDTRNTKVIDIYRTLQHFTDNITVYDPFANAERVAEEYGLTLTTELAQLPTDNDVVVLCVPHQCILQTDVYQYLKPEGIIYDVKGKLPLSERTYKL